MGVDLEAVFAAMVTAEEAFALPERLNSELTVVAACRAYYQHMKPCLPGLELHAWRWDEDWPAITAPSAIVEAWGSPYWGSVLLSGTPGILSLQPNRIGLHVDAKLTGFAADYEGCQAPIRRVCRAIARAIGTDRVLYVPDSGDWPSEVGDLSVTRFDEALARLTAWGPPVCALGALQYGDAVRSGYHYADGALRRPDGRPVPAEELARPDLLGGFAYYVDDFRDLA